MRNGGIVAILEKVFVLDARETKAERLLVLYDFLFYSNLPALLATL